MYILKLIKDGNELYRCLCQLIPRLTLPCIQRSETPVQLQFSVPVTRIYIMVAKDAGLQTAYAESEMNCIQC